MADYQITIKMEDDTVEALADGNYYLYAFKAVQSAITGGQPVIWFKTKNFSQETTVDWGVSYGAYTSKTTKLTDGTKITASASYPIDLGQMLHVTSDAGTGNVANDGGPGVISIFNESPNDTQFSCGITQVSSAGKNMLCALPLYGQHLDVITPIQQVLLTFATDAEDIGAVITQCLAPSLMVRLDNETSRTVSYDINSNWKANQQGWCTNYKATTKTAPLLIQSSNKASLAKTRLIARHAAPAVVDSVNANALPRGYYYNVKITWNNDKSTLPIRLTPTPTRY